jgi:hypothetical protein
MIRHKLQNQSQRRGIIAVLACFMLIVVLGIAAFAIDLGYWTNSQAELQRSADAAALAGCWQLVYKGTPGTPVDMTAGVAAASPVATQYAALNPACGSKPNLGSGDVVVGYLANPSQKGATISAASPNTCNAVQVTIRRTADQNGQVPTFFARLFGLQGMNSTATATAAVINNFGGFQPPINADGTGNLMILPFALDKQTWDALQAGSGPDNWSYNASSNSVSAGSDGIREANLFPEGTGSPGNRGTVNIGASNNSTATLCRQITSGISAADLAYYPNGQLTFDSSGNMLLNANPGISAGCKSALASIIGQTRMIPIFTSVSGNGNNANYNIVEFVGVRILDVQLTGSMSTKHVTVQPATIWTRGGIPATSANLQQSSGIYSPVWLAH